MSKTHELKCDPLPFGEVWIGNKKAELRIDDGRNFEVGDKFILKETRDNRKNLTGRQIHGEFTHIIDVGHWVEVKSEHPVLMISIKTTEMVEGFLS